MIWDITQALEGSRMSKRTKILLLDAVNSCLLHIEIRRTKLTSLDLNFVFEVGILMPPAMTQKDILRPTCKKFKSTTGLEG